MEDRKPLTTGEIARYCHVTYACVLKWIKSDKLKAYSTPGGHFRILRKDFKEFLQHYNMPIDERLFPDHRKKVLVVDDDVAIVELIVHVLQEDDLNCDTAFAKDGYEAGHQIATFRPDLVILDVMMPKMDGFEVCRRIRSNPETHDMKILCITGFTDAENIEKMVACGANFCLSKPLDMKELKYHVKKLLGLARRKEDVPWT